MNLKATDKAPLFAPLDVDGDGKDDIVCVEQRKKDDYYPCTIVQRTGSGKLIRTEVKLHLPEGVSKDIEKVFVGDYNNDGLPDLILLYDGGYMIYYNSGGNVPSSIFIETNTKSGSIFGNYWRMQQGDFDGDGLTDFVYNKSGKPACGLRTTMATELSTLSNLRILAWGITILKKTTVVSQ